MTDDETTLRAAHSIRRSHYECASGVVNDELVGGQWEWSWGLPGTLRAITSPGSDAAVPDVPKPTDPHEQSRGYWAVLHYLLKYRLGWESPYLGLYRWSETGRQVDDLTLQFVDAIWGADDGLDIYYAWALRRQLRYDLRSGHPSFPSDLESANRELSQKGVEIAGRYERRFAHFGSSSYDPLHLGGHLNQEPGPTPGARLIKAEPERQLAVLLSPDMRWYPALLNLESELPMRGVHSWKVEVHVDSVGLIGTFRRSADTGLWFSGKHSTHMMGNA
ncbi:hypothetical protein [Curtobacterium sp. MCSS17_005]|uniref:hypothetical protein n=1 Tax=Curtobacterium sp. MCSS17_005 TaxID=2175641 RepID=UPI0011B5238C|nr:hypothetical protein [Curtobacterium sp. MCSS17_005]WIB34410.1 hypothetical protein DEJ20_08065 [Curtobacterium sp. MCSS17_005]